MKIATWNLNNRVGKVRFRPEAADRRGLEYRRSGLTEFFRRTRGRFRNAAQCGLCRAGHVAAAAEVANRVLIASRLPAFR
jgi:hypothetical protein